MHFLENVLELNRMEEIKLSWFLFFKITFFKIMCPLFPFPQCPICTFLCYKKKKKLQMSASYLGCPQELNILLKVTCISLFSIKMLF